ncbi:hypothetical protein KP509_01G013700 [Ceratopteris richardii]|uniref:Uncharacterized protein n=1 Tax=Ceratopteris richardii TaxID=49495 RepID=A0A8T2VIY2_CERRI|nr:hypothetical protein KP509_01G013700 [Ceratopteris richardii]KAH7445540.1 hypothetical protein KP509_01G013700 [Ceratopteris richardii]
MALPSTSLPQCFDVSDFHSHLGKLRKALTCSLCHHLFREPACLSCNHHFCLSCLVQSIETISACPKCKEPAATSQARIAPEMDDLVDIFQNLETFSGSVIANGRDLSIIVKRADECLSPNTMKGQKHEVGKGLSSVVVGTESESRKRDASLMDLACTAVLPAPKRIQLPCPPLPADTGGLLNEDPGSSSRAMVDTPSKDTVANASVGGQKQLIFASITMGDGQVRNMESAAAVDEQVSEPVRESINGQPEVSKKDMIRRQFRVLRSNSRGRENPGASTGPSSCDQNQSQKQEPDMGAQNTDDQPVDDLSKMNNLPSHQSERGAQEITCAFCHKADSQVAGKMIHFKDGVPVSVTKRSGHLYHVHKNCAEWSPGVYYEDKVAKNIPKEIARGHKMKCHVCGLRGAVLGCYLKRCRKSFHYPCAHTIPCRWNKANYLVLCPEHTSGRFPNESSIESTSKTMDAPVTPSASIAACGPKPSEEVEACNGDPSQQWSAMKLVLCGSGLSPKANELLATFARLYHLQVEKAWTPSVTHLIVGTDEVGASRRTFKFLMANLAGKWILKIDWVSACMASKRYVNEEPYEINLDIHGLIGGPRHARAMVVEKVHDLFEGLIFHFVGEYAAAYKADLEALVTAAGGMVLNEISDSMEKGVKVSLIIVYCKDVYSDSNAINMDGSSKRRYLEAKSFAETFGAKVVGHTWILDSVAAYELQPFE